MSISHRDYPSINVKTTTGIGKNHCHFYSSTVYNIIVLETFIYQTTPDLKLLCSAHKNIEYES